MKIILIQFRFNKPEKGYNPNDSEPTLQYMFPLGLPYISSVLKQYGYDVTCLNLNHGNGTTEYLVNKEMFLKGYDLAFVGGLSLFYPHIRDLIHTIRIASPKTKIVCGGGIITAQPELMMDLLKPDYGIVGEGEESVLKAVAFPEERLITSEPITNPDKLPFPDYNSFNFSEYVDNVKMTDYFAFDVVDNPRVYPLLASRSCPYNCTFCFHPLGQKYRQRSIDNIMEELKQNVPKYNINIVTIYDEMFSNDFERMKEFCGKFKAFSDTLPHKLWFVCNIRVDKVTDEMLKLMKQSGACTVSYGLESYSQTVLDSMKKHIIPEQIHNAALLTRKNSLGFQGNFIFGDPAETLETAKETLEYVQTNRNILGTAVALDFVVPFQGSQLYKRCVIEGTIPNELKLIKDREITGYPKFPTNMTHLSDSDFEKLQDMVFEERMNTPYTIPSKALFADFSMDYTTCPSCGKIVEIPEVSIPAFRPLNVGCRNCHYRFDVVKPYYPIIQAILKRIRRKNTRRLIDLKARLT
jgi:radical SAM superfamily enzyme YgiQ (UPF0313 family)